MNAAALKDRLRTDLKIAMQAKASGEVRLLRTLIAALDNAEAVPREDGNNLPVAFGDASGEVARLRLDAAAVDDLLAAETEARLTAAADYERHNRPGEGARLRHEAELIARYRNT